MPADRLSALAAFGLWLVAAAPAAAQPVARAPASFTQRVWLPAGSRALVRFRSPPRSPLEWMARLPVILKADDYGDALDPVSLRFFDFVRGLGGVVTLGLITSRIGDDPGVAESYRRLAAEGFEPWFHGHTHAVAPEPAEFARASLDQQLLSFELGRRRALDLLGLELRAFGAPENAYDAVTADAIVRSPWIETWLFGPTESPIPAYPKVIEIEEPVGVISPPAMALAGIDHVLRRDPEALVIQLHPRMWQAEDEARIRAILTTLVERDRFRFTTPTDEQHWRHERSRIRTRRLADGRFEIDLGAAKYDQRLDLGPGGGEVGLSLESAAPRTSR